MSPQESVGEADPDEVFAALSDGTRVAILQALWDADGHEATFSELREAVGAPDSGRFNYHLDKLVERFVSRTETGYELTQAGMQINGALRAGAYTMDGTIEPIALDAPCSACDRPRALRYEDETVQVLCDECRTGYQFGVPPSVFAGYEREEIPAVASRYLRNKIRELRSGFCPFCDGRVVPTVVSIGEGDDTGGASDRPEELGDAISGLPLIEYTCERCGAEPTAGLPLTFLDHPAVVGFYYERGIDVQNRSIWEFDDLDPDLQSVRETDPIRVSVTYEADGDTLTLMVDDALEVLDVEP